MIWDIFFPPLCLSCKQKTPFKYFCKDCWLQSALLSPVGRCSQCFDEIDEKQGACRTCKKAPQFPCTRACVFDGQSPVRQLIYHEETHEALAALAFYQSVQLHWPVPDVIIPVLARPLVMHSFAAHHQRPCPELFIRQDPWSLREELLDEHQTILLFDEGATHEQLQQATRAIADASPKKTYLLSLWA